MVILSVVASGLCKDTSTLKENSKDGVCHEKHCQEVADFMHKGLNEEVDPCENFYQFACGGWMKSHKIPDKKEEYSAINELSDNNDKLLKQFLEGKYKGKLCDKKHPDSSSTIMKVRNFYTSCLDSEDINKQGAAPLRQFIDKLGGWDIDEDFDGDNWDFLKTLRTLHSEYPAEIFFTVDVDVDPKNRQKNIITIDEAKLSLPQITYYTNPKAVERVIQYATDVAMLTLKNKKTDADTRKTVHAKMANVFKLEEKISKFYIPKQAKRFTRVPISKLQEAVSEFDWFSHLQAIFKDYVEIKKDDHLVVLSNDFYMTDLMKLINETDVGTLSNYMIWHMVKDMVPFLSQDFTDLHTKFRKDLTGVSHKKPRNEMCFKYTDEILGPLVGALFIRYAFCMADKEEVEEMMDLIVAEFVDNAQHIDWVSEKTLKAIEKKAHAVVKKVGYPNYLYNEKTFFKRYKDITIKPDTFFENVVSIDKFSNHRTFKKITIPVDPHQWVSVPHMANAFYVVTKNEIVIPAGILQPPFFYAKPIPRSVSYGAIGHVLGHELTHGFDTLGRKFNDKGELISKRSLQPVMRSSAVKKNQENWSKESIERFNSRTSGLKKQFDEYRISSGDLHIDGDNTLGENIADAGGVKMAYKAYKKWVKDNGEEYTLPKLKKTNEELFFIGYAQKECHLSTMKALTEAIKDDVHAPSMFRITGTLSNSEEFAQAFKCKLDSQMNPKNKNHIWRKR